MCVICRMRHHLESEPETVEKVEGMVTAALQKSADTGCGCQITLNFRETGALAALVALGIEHVKVTGAIEHAIDDAIEQENLDSQRGLGRN